MMVNIDGVALACDALPERERRLAAIAHFRLGVLALTAKGTDGQDFHQCHVDGLRQALEDAYEAGRKAGA
jgi:hypothetical protein